VKHPCFPFESQLVYAARLHELEWRSGRWPTRIVSNLGGGCSCVQLVPTHQLCFC
jgi:hypothetical protein